MKMPSLESDARHRTLVVILGFAEYGLIFVYEPAVLSLCIDRQFSFFFLLYCSQQTSGSQSGIETIIKHYSSRLDNGGFIQGQSFTQLENKQLDGFSCLH